MMRANWCRIKWSGWRGLDKRKENRYYACMDARTIYQPRGSEAVFDMAFGCNSSHGERASKSRRPYQRRLLRVF